MFRGVRPMSYCERAVAASGRCEVGLPRERMSGNRGWFTRGRRSAPGVKLLQSARGVALHLAAMKSGQLGRIDFRNSGVDDRLVATSESGMT
jgi:hypothetical protein